MLREAIKAASARKRATRLLWPYAERASWGNAPLTEAEWLAPRRVGFLAGAVNRIVAQDDFKEEGLFAVQLGVWEDLTRSSSDLFATRLYLLSSEGGIDVTEGYEAGARFAEAVLLGEEEAALVAWNMAVTLCGDRGFDE